MQRTSESSDRLDWMDALRGIAALMVVLEHVCSDLWSAFERFTHTYFYLGQAGVIVFFLCSGYIIPHSLAHGSLRRFWTRRVFRLYPLYWVTCGVAALILVPTRRELLSNLTMLPQAFGTTPLLGVFWTLACEMVFYVCVSFTHRLAHADLLLVLYLSVLALLLFRFVPATPLVGYLAVMYLGSVLHHVQAGTRSRRTGTLSTALVCLMLTVMSWQPDGWRLNGALAWALATGRLGAVGIFLLALTYQRHRWPRFLVALGLISYSLYLTHELIPLVVPATPYPVVSVGLWLGITLLASIATYRFVERPGIAMGRRLTRQVAPSSAGVAEQTVASTI